MKSIAKIENIEIARVLESYLVGRTTQGFFRFERKCLRPNEGVVVPGGSAADSTKIVKGYEL